LPRKALYKVAIFVGVLAGVVNTYLEIDFTLRPMLFVCLLSAIVIVVSFHEAVHGLIATLLGHKPLFGFKPPLVYITFTGKIPRNHFILVALAPLVLLDVLFGYLYIRGLFKLFFDFCLIINTIGALGDVWIVLMLLNAEKASLIQDTKNGFEVWVADEI